MPLVHSIRLRVGLDVRMWHHTGVGRYIRSLVRHLPDQGIDLTAWGPKEILSRPEFALVRHRPCDVRIHSVGEQARLALDLFPGSVDVFHSPHLNSPLASRVPCIVTIHDLIPLHFRETLGPAGRAYFWAMATRLVPLRAKRILTVSEWTRRDLISHGVPAGRIRVVPLGVDAAFSEEQSYDRVGAVLQKWHLRAPYILYAGQWKAYKNLKFLLEAFKGLLANHNGTRPEPTLVLLGNPDRGSGLLEQMASLGITDQVSMPGYLHDEKDVAAIFQGARCFAFPSKHEGFGLAPLEAMAAGIPVVCGYGTALDETLGTAAHRVLADDPRGWVLAFEELLWNEDRRRTLIDRGRQQADRFNWETTAHLTAQVYREALNIE